MSISDVPHAQRRASHQTYFKDCLEDGRFSEMEPISSMSLAMSRSLRCEGLGRLEMKLIRCLMFLRIRGDCFFIGGSNPRPDKSDAHSASWASSLAFIANAWSAILLASLSSTCFSSSNIRLRSSRFSDSIRAHSPSNSRILRARTLLDLARSLFCLNIFLRTASTSR